GLRGIPSQQCEERVEILDVLCIVSSPDRSAVCHDQSDSPTKAEEQPVPLGDRSQTWRNVSCCGGIRDLALLLSWAACVVQYVLCDSERDLRHDVLLDHCASDAQKRRAPTPPHS